MPIRINQLRTVKRGINNEAFPVPDGYQGGQTMAAPGTSDPVGNSTSQVEISTTENITIDAYGAGSVVWMFANETRWFPAAPGQTFTWSQRT